MNTQCQGNAPARPKLLTRDTPIIILPTLAAAFGILEAVFLQQLHYLSLQAKIGIRHDGHKWIYNTLDQWHGVLPCWSVASIERAITKLKKLGVIHIEKLSPHRSNRTNYYRIDYAKIADLADFVPPSNDDPDPLSLMEVSPQAAANHSLTLRSSTPSACGLGYTKTTKENTKNSSKSEKPIFESLNGTDQPIHTEPSPAQLSSVPSEQRQLWQQLRRAKLDIAVDDPRLKFWIARCLVKNVVQTLLNHLDGRWHSAEQLGLPCGQVRTVQPINATARVQLAHDQYPPLRLDDSHSVTQRSVQHSPQRLTHKHHSRCHSQPQLAQQA